ncbi:hypothetical protein LZC95_48295 [Pendulispora brunnea]|uniref:Uncharacterized protein n=1 Tax=Pendulispora brunnea TaxID=2905690 RepID=A0ABZ2KAV7_9BACT
MRTTKIGLWTACCAFLLSGVIAGCSGTDEQTPAENRAEQSVESAQEGISCAAMQGKTLSSKDVEVTLKPGDGVSGTLAAPNSCVCCDSLRAGARQYCADRGRPLGYAECGGACGLCGCDNAYSYIDFSCG